MKNLLTLSLMIFNFATTATATTRTPFIDLTPNPINQDYHLCLQAKSILVNLVKSYTYYDQPQECRTDSDCSQIWFPGSNLCAQEKIVNKSGQSGMKLLEGNQEYQRLVNIINEEQRYGKCGPQPRCAPRPPGSAKCRENVCRYVFDGWE